MQRLRSFAHKKSDRSFLESWWLTLLRVVALVLLLGLSVFSLVNLGRKLATSKSALVREQDVQRPQPFPSFLICHAQPNLDIYLWEEGGEAEAELGTACTTSTAEQGDRPCDSWPRIVTFSYSEEDTRKRSGRRWKRKRRREREREEGRTSCYHVNWDTSKTVQAGDEDDYIEIGLLIGLEPGAYAAADMYFFEGDSDPFNSNSWALAKPGEGTIIELTRVEYEGEAVQWNVRTSSATIWIPGVNTTIWGFSQIHVTFKTFMTTHFSFQNPYGLFSFVGEAGGWLGILIGFNLFLVINRFAKWMEHVKSKPKYEDKGRPDQDLSGVELQCASPTTNE